MTPHRENRRHQIDDAYRAIGRYVVAFSELVSEMRYLIGLYIAGGEKAVLVEMALGEAQAAQISHAFFGLCRDATDFSAAETEIESQLRREIEEEIIPSRNDIAHGDWMVGAFRLTKTGIADDVVPPRLTRIVPHHKAGAFSVRHITVEELDAMTDRLLEVTTMTVEFGRLALGLAVMRTTDDGGGTVSVGEMRVQDIYEVPGSRRPKDKPSSQKARTPPRRATMTRTGPRADEVARVPYVA